ncbi:MAG: hypothetical protein L6R40_000630 [Gallowayella cf. fulva]|nr:MAG: hypothetical protein L6R40_000630 [Xanthomendoza cf. fulva]
MSADPGASETDLLTYIFDIAHTDKPVLVDASNPSRFLTSRTARVATRKLIAGLRAEGFKAGECVCIHAFNDVRRTLFLQRTMKSTEGAD